MKKLHVILIIALALALVCALAACNDGDQTPAVTPAPSTPADNTPADNTPADNTPADNTPADNTPADNTPTEYAITFCNENGTVLETKNYAVGATPSYTYNKADTAEWDYTVEGWSLTQGGAKLAALPTVSGEATYYAKVSQVKRQYTVMFVSNGGSAVSPITQDYGTQIAKPANPKQDGKAFVCWCTDPAATQEKAFPFTLSGNITLYAAWNDRVDLKPLLSSLLSGYFVSPEEYIPESMRAGARTISDEKADLSYTDGFVSVSSMPTRGYGEQWHMILNNINQSQTFFKVLRVVDTVSAGTAVAFNNYLDSRPADTAHHTLTHGIYTATVDFDGTTLLFIVDYTATIPALGEQTIQIALALNVATGVKTVRVQAGNPNALTYTVSANSYTFAIKYLGVRTAYLSLTRDESGNVTGQINEHLTIEGIGTHSSADFYIGDTYVSAVGNKASGIPGFKGYINEVYLVSNGQLQGYEVREKLSVLQYNTLWFDLHDISGITSIKYRAKDEDAGIEAAFFVNGSSTEWASKEVGGFSLKKASRRFDIEFRTQYFYRYNAETEKYEEVKVSVPMLFVQEENYSTLTSDVASVNSGVTLSVTLDSARLQKIEDDYDTLVDVFIAHKDAISEDAIRDMIGAPVSWEE